MMLEKKKKKKKRSGNGEEEEDDDDGKRRVNCGLPRFEPETSKNWTVPKTHKTLVGYQKFQKGVRRRWEDPLSMEALLYASWPMSASAERAGKIIVQPKQVLTWFQNRRRPHRSKVKAPANSNVSSMPRDDSVPARTVAHSGPVPSGRSGSDNNNQMKFEAKSASDGAWHDVELFTVYRVFDTIEPEVCVRFAGFWADEDEWVNVPKHVRHRSLPCAASESVVVLNGDLILCFQESKDQDLYFDAHVVDVERRRHDIRGCRCRFLVRFVHVQSEEIVPLRKICRRPETDYRLQLSMHRRSNH